jgi:hypothetical protein
MENAPIITVTFTNFAPGVDEDVARRYEKWITEAYMPMAMKIAGISGADRYAIVRKNREYPSMGIFRHYGDKEAYQDFLKTQVWTDVQEDIKAWEKRRVREAVWSVTYELVHSFRAGTNSPVGRKDTRFENASLTHLEAFRMSPEEAGKFNNWFNEYSRVSIPLFMKTGGLKGYDYFKLSGMAPVASAR